MNNKNSNFSLLKIILILMVIVLHYFNSNIGGLFANVSKWSTNYFLSHLLESFSIVAVNVFVLITGYFSCKKKDIKVSKVIKLYSIAIFYGIVFFIGIVLLKKHSLDFILLKQFFKASFCRWYVVNYCILYLLIPFINKLISNLKQKRFETLLLILIIVFYLLNTLFGNMTLIDKGYGIVNFITLYMIGAYIKLYKDDYKSKLVYLIYVTCTIITTIISFFYTRAWDYITIFNLVASISLFIIFKNIKVKKSNFLDLLSTYTFAIYIIHENPLISKFIYRNIFKSNLFWNNNLMIIHLIGTVLGIFLMCIIIEFMRRKLLGKIFDDQIDKIKIKISCD